MKVGGIGRLVLGLILASYLSLFVSGEFERGDRYWSGKPQAIGIDFSSDLIYAVQADGPGNYTTLGYVQPKSKNNYCQLLYELYAQRHDFGGSVVIDEGNDSPHSSFSHFKERARSWLQPPLGWYHHIAHIWGLTRREGLQNAFSSDVEDSHIPKPSVSKYKDLVSSRERLTRLQGLMPKWFRTSRGSKSFTKANIVFWLYTLLEELKRNVLRDHNIAITSASIAIPDWAADIQDLVDESCLLAGIENWEQPRTRIDAALRYIDYKAYGTALIIDLGPYQLNAHFAEWDEERLSFAQRSSISQQQYGTLLLLYKLLNILLGTYGNNSIGLYNREPDDNWITYLNRDSALQQVALKRTEIIRGQWVESLDLAVRIVDVELEAPALGFTVSLNMSAQDLVDAETAYADEITEFLRSALIKYDEVYNYIQTLPSSEFYLDALYSKSFSELVELLPDSSQAASWLQLVDHVVVLNTAYEAAIVYYAADQALGWNPAERASNGMCFPTLEIAAQGAALRALDWIGYWEADQDTWWDEGEGTWQSEDAFKEYEYEV